MIVGINAQKKQEFSGLIPLKGYSPFDSHGGAGLAWHINEFVMGPVQLVAVLVAFWQNHILLLNIILHYYYPDFTFLLNATAVDKRQFR